MLGAIPEQTPEPFRAVGDFGRVPFGRAARGLDIDGETPVVVKWVDPDRLPIAERDDLIAETRALTRLVQPGLPVVYEMREETEGLRLVFEPPPAAPPVDSRDFDREALIEHGSQLLLLLAEAHVHGVLHRHLGQASVLRTGADALTLTGFGLTRLRDDPTWEPAPEVAAEQPATLVADLHAAGRLIQSWARQAESRLLGDPSEDPLAAVLARATDRNPSARYEDAAEMARALQRAATLPWSPRERATPKRIPPVAKPHDRGSSGRGRGWALAAILVVAVTGGIWLAGGFGDGGETAQPAETARQGEGPRAEPGPTLDTAQPVAPVTDGAPERLARARRLVEQERAAEAEPILEELLLSGELANPVPVLDLLGTLRLQAGRVEEAAELLVRAVVLQPDAELYYKLGLALAAAGRADEALEQLRAAQELDPGSSEIREAIRHLTPAHRDSGGPP